MYNIIWDIKFKTNGTTYSLQTASSIDIECSVDNLADTAVVTLPEAVMNQVLNIGNEVARGSEVVIKAGYDKTLKTEFVGYVLDLVSNEYYNIGNYICDRRLKKMIKFKLIHYFNQNPLNSNAKFSVLKAFRPNGSVPVIDNRNILITAALPYVNNISISAILLGPFCPPMPTPGIADERV